MKQSAKVPTQLSESLGQRLNAYALAASAAGVGVGVLAVAQPAEAKIVYTPVFVGISTLNPQHFWPLDINHDGIVDFSFSAYYWVGMSSERAYLRFLVKASNGAVGGSIYDAALHRGALVGRPRQRFGGELMAAEGTVQGVPSFRGPWAGNGHGVSDRYLGLKFSINGKTHYGWARLGVGMGGVDIAASLTGYAYETIPNKPIIAGRTHDKDEATLGRLAQGASSIVSRRKN